jgi:predicted RNA methylase
MPYNDPSDLTRFSFNTNYIIESIRSGFSSIDDKIFDKYVYPEKIQKISSVHWTPISIAMKASDLLVKNEMDRVLDIGSGAGKFCVIGALYTKGTFHGVEQRRVLHIISKKLIKEFEVTNVKFIHSNIDRIKFSDYNAFYFFNPFEENIYTKNRIDDNVLLSFSKYMQYTIYVRNEFEKLPINTRIVTYCSDHEMIPSGYIQQYQNSNDRLSLWVKKYNTP